MKSKSFIANFEDLDRWIVPKQMLLAFDVPPSWHLMSVADLVTPVSNKVKVEPDKMYRLVGIRLYGQGTFHRETVLGKEISADYLTPCVSNALIYNRLFAWKESFAVVPSEHSNCYVSNEFPQFVVNQSLVLPLYIYLFFTTKEVTRVIDKLSVGSSAISRNRFKEEDFLDFTIPLPPMFIQEKIVQYWRTANTYLRNAKTELDTVISTLDKELHERYRPNDENSALVSRFFVINWDKLDTWDAKNARAKAFSLETPAFVTLDTFAEESTILVKPWEDPKKEWPVYGVSNTEGVFFSHWQKGSKFSSPYKRIKKDWFFHNPTRSSVGSLGKVPEVPDDAITSPEYQVWRIKDNTLPDYVDTLISTDFFIRLIQFHRVGGVKQRLYVDNLLKIPVPDLSLEEQRNFASSRKTALQNIEKAQFNLNKLKEELELIILGKRLFNNDLMK
ncbi:MAG: restriction endonuclease subunit S [Anaerolineae bacterium]|nr:restriction endonuclease subunit S [Anaerolineae bacterium]